MSKIFGFFLGALTGGILGAAAALLLTPVSGRKMRSQIDERMRDMQKEIMDARNQKRAELESQLQTLRAPKV
ncbi:MAG TPA: YtxH domain-containing protein [Leptolinea sp.]